MKQIENRKKDRRSIEISESETDSIESLESNEDPLNSKIHGIERSYCEKQRKKSVEFFNELIRKYGVEKTDISMSEKEFEKKKNIYDFFYKCDGVLKLFLLTVEGPKKYDKVGDKLKIISNRECTEPNSHYKVFNVHGKRATLDNKSIMVSCFELY